MADLSQEMWNLSLQSWETLYCYYRNAYGNLTWQGGDLPWGTPTHKITRSFDHMVFQHDVTNQNRISTTKVVMVIEFCKTVTYLDGLLPINFITMATKFGKMVTYLEGLWIIKSSNALITWSSKVTLQTKTIISQPPECLWPRNMAGW